MLSARIGQKASCLFSKMSEIIEGFPKGFVQKTPAKMADESKGLRIYSSVYEILKL